MSRSYRFTPKLWSSLAAAAGIAVTAALGNWQLDRAAEKREVRDQLARLSREPAINLSAAEVRAEDLRWRRVTARGSFEPKHAVYLDNRVYRGVAGYHVIMPLRIGASRRYVLVNRGWVAGHGVRGELPPVVSPAGEVEVTGLAVVPPRRVFELSTRTVEGHVWQNLVLERYRQAVPIAIQPIVIQQESALEDGLVREWAPPDAGIDRHYGYAFQWIALAVAILVFYVVTHVTRTPSAK